MKKTLAMIVIALVSVACVEDFQNDRFRAKEINYICKQILESEDTHTITIGFEPKCENGFAEIADGVCRTYCLKDAHCGARHYCDKQTNNCVGKLFEGECQFDNECANNSCVCGRCIDNKFINEVEYKYYGIE